MKNAKCLIIFAIVNFIAWNYLGILLIVNIVIIFSIINNNINKKLWKYVGITFITFFVYNISATFWLLNVKLLEGIYAIIANSTLMTIPGIISYFLYRYFKIPIYSFIFTWLSFEYLHSNWSFALNWLTFGNVLGNQVYFAQWYSLLGVYAGSLWFLILAYLIHYIFIQKNKQLYLYSSFILIFILPIGFSLSTYFFTPLKRNEQLNVFTFSKIDSIYNNSNYDKTKFLYKNTKNIEDIDFIITIETFYSNIHLSTFQKGEIEKYLKLFYKKNKHLTFILGADIVNAEKNRFNSVAVKSKNKKLLIRTKKKYVPIIEFIPSFITDLSGDTTYFKKSKNDNSEEIIKKHKVFVPICYESIFSEFCAKESYNADIIFLLASEKFLNGSNIAKQQYLNIVKLRAIESGKNILKCSLDGISCSINEKGEIDKYIYDNEKTTLYKINDKTLYQSILSIVSEF